MNDFRSFSDRLPDSQENFDYSSYISGSETVMTLQYAPICRNKRLLLAAAMEAAALRWSRSWKRN
jgi:hypothetical protein